jgi:hypothetical protein
MSVDKTLYEEQVKLLSRWKTRADKMLRESGSWDECPFCDSLPPYGPKPYDWHNKDCPLHDFLK